MQPETVEMPVSVEAVDSVNSSSCTLVCSSTDNDPEENSSCCHFGGPELDCSSSSAPLPVVSAADCAATVSSQVSRTRSLAFIYCYNNLIAILEAFFGNFKMSPTGPPSFFLKFCNRMDLQKIRTVLLFHFLAL